MRLRGRRRSAAVLACTAALGLSACGGSDGAGEDGTLTVFAAASLHETFEDIGELYTQETGRQVGFTFAGSSGLVEQLSHGAPADVLATADEASMDRARELDLVEGGPEVFVSNHLVLITPAENPANIATLEDAAEDGVETVLCAVQVPCGAAAQQLLEATGVEITPVSEETSVTDVLGRVRTGEADTGLVYATDALQAGDQVRTFPVPGAEDQPNAYPIAQMRETEQPVAATEFITFVLEDERARQILEDAGFSPPDGREPQ
ncbi:molybdate ABC transporter substrate-binding protein [Nesterenkonia flava]|uniref:Molybdate ABC transporter substrate-binding protein n=1 Tax=Nesterenkonia flava TaxID=469799 RepID=A0ABU1FVL7_9MICC|nr:molybdate ABC transporter substrate-binding protein [Nesterenkonia flava]MDR5712715.1 molybdate ABC transporter substrate-binding protein [Nesterenkonia flava]